MTFEPEAMEKVIELVRKYTPMMHSPFYSEQCRKDGSCPVCSMDENVYRLAREIIAERDEKARILKGLELPSFHEDYTTDAGHCSPGCPACKILGWQK